MLKLISGLLRQGWKTISIAEYKQFCQRDHIEFGLTCNADWLQLVDDLLQIKTHYYGCFKHGRLVSAVPLWGDYIAGDRRYLVQEGKDEIIDFGSPEIIPPLQGNTYLPFKVQRICDNKNISNRFRLRRGRIARIRCLMTETSKKRRRNMERSVRSAEKEGIRFVPVEQFFPDELADIYNLLHFMRWKHKPKGSEIMKRYLTAMQPFLFGHVMYRGDVPIAFDLVLRSQSPGLSYIECINAGYNPEYSDLSPGSLISYVNIKAHDLMAREKEVKSRGSFGSYSEGYKSLWCKPEPMYRLLGI